MIAALREGIHNINVIILIVLGTGFILVRVIWPLFVIIASIAEKQMIHCFEPCREPDISEQSGYTQAMNKAAAEMGFIPCGWFRHCRYKATVTVWVAPDYLTMVVVSGGKMIGIPLKMTLLYSKAANGFALLTTDESRPLDMSGLIVKQLLINADMTELYDAHLRWLANSKAPAEPFNTSAILGDYEQIDAIRVARLVEMGLARYVSYDLNAWRYTFKGAVQYYKCQRASNKECMKQSERFKTIKRPGTV